MTDQQHPITPPPELFKQWADMPRSEEALAVLDDTCDRLDAAHENIIRRALERLQELEGQGDG